MVVKQTSLLLLLTLIDRLTDDPTIIIRNQSETSSKQKFLSKFANNDWKATIIDKQISFRWQCLSLPRMIEIV